MKGQDLARGTVRGTLWNSATLGLSKGLLLISTVVLARVLVPAEFGLMALGLLFMAYLDALGDLGVGPAMIYRQSDSSRDATTAQIIAAVTGGALAVATVLSAPWIAGFFDEPRAGPIIRVLAIAFFVEMLSTVHESRLKKDLDFRKRFVPEVGKAFAKGTVSILLALLGFGVWSLVWGQVAGSVVGTLLYWRLAGWPLRLTFDPAVARELFRFGLPVTVLGVLGILIQNMDYLIIGRRLDATALGYYTIGFRLPELLIMNFCYVVSHALFPAYARLQRDRPALQAGFARTLRYVAVVTVPAGLGLAVVASDVVVVLFGEKWRPAIPVMQVLAVYALVYSLSFNVGDVYKATGRPGVLNVIGVAKVVVTAPILWFAASMGIVAVAVGMVIATVIMTIAELTVASRLLDARLPRMLAEYVPALAAGLVMLAGTVAVRHAMEGSGPVLRLAAALVAGATLYLAALWLASPTTVRDVAGLLRSRNSTSAAT